MTTSDFADQSIRQYLDRLAGEAPEPGGGSVAALVAALGAALVTMVADLTLGKEKFAAAWDQIGDIRVESERLRGRLQQLITLDAIAYGAVADAMSLPQGSDQETTARRAKLQKTLVAAANVPLETAEAAVEVGRLCLPAAESGNPNAVSDAGVAIILAEAAVQSAALNVKINLGWITDEEFNRHTWSRTEAALSEAAALRGMVLAVTYGKLK